MRFRWKGIRALVEDINPEGKNPTERFCRSIGKPVKNIVRLYVLLESDMLPEPRFAAVLFLPETEEGGIILEGVIIYLVPDLVDLQGLFRLLSEANDLPPSFLFWLMCGPDACMKLCESVIHNMAMYCIAETDQDRKSLASLQTAEGEFNPLMHDIGAERELMSALLPLLLENWDSPNSIIDLQSLRQTADAEEAE